ncbi:MAG TPA: hypothetical protein VF824_17985 [Thermoanaerobaculia bacterium]|jgi:hypothetical protein
MDFSRVRTRVLLGVVIAAAIAIIFYAADVPLGTGATLGVVIVVFAIIEVIGRVFFRRKA